MGLLNLLLQNQSGLDTNPIPTPGNGPIEPANGEFNTGANPFIQTWNSNNTYLNSFEGPINVGIQPPTLKKTGLDVDDPNYIPSTTTPNTLTAYPATALGGLRQSAVQFLQIWNPVISYNNIVAGALTSPLEQSLDETGLDNTNFNFTPTTVTPYNLTNYPNQATGEFGGAPSQYNLTYTPSSTYENKYINNPVLFDTLQTTTLDETGLDIENQNAAPTTTTPQPVPPTPQNLPSQVFMGEFQGAASQYTQNYGPNSTYLNTFNPQTQPNTVLSGETGLDNTNLNSLPTTITPLPVPEFPPILPPQTFMGEFQGIPSQFTPSYTPNLNGGYLNIYDNLINDNTNPQILNLENSGLDIENQNVAPTTTTPNTITQYPALASGEFNAGAGQYTQTWNPTNTYLNSNFTNAQEGTLDLTGLDNTDTSLLPTTISPQQVPSSPQILPPLTFMGEFQGAASQFIPQYNPNPGQGYLNTLNTIISNAGNPQISTLDETGLDVENQNAAPTTYIVPFLDNITNYPILVTGELNGAPTPYSQNYTPLLTYNNLIANTPQGPFSNLELALDETGLDIENQDAAPTTYVVPTTDDTFSTGDVPLYVHAPSAINNSAPRNYTQTWSPNNENTKYYDHMKNIFQLDYL